MRKLLVLATMAVAGLLAVPAFAAVVGEVDIDTFEAANDGFAGPYMTDTLDAGQPYLITIDGTYSVWWPGHWNNVCAGTPESSPETPSSDTTNGKVGLDAEHIFAWPMASPSLCPSGSPIGVPPLHTSMLQISLDGGTTWAHIEPIDAAYNSAHSYQYLVVGLGSPAAIGFRFRDSNTTDNYGVLTATVEATDASAFATGGGTVTDVNGNEANFGFVGRNQKGKIQGSLQYQDHAGKSVHADSLTGVLVLKSTSTAYITGNASVNGEPGHTFMLIVQDNGEPGAGSDTFRLDLDGSTVASGTLTGGNIQVHAK